MQTTYQYSEFLCLFNKKINKQKISWSNTEKL